MKTLSLVFTFLPLSMSSLTTLLYLVFTLVCVPTNKSLAQVQKRTVVAVLHADVQGLYETPEQAGNMLRMELEKLETMEVIDKYDVFYLLKQSGIEVKGCYGKLCLIEAGKAVKAEKMLMGGIERYGNSIMVTLRLFDVEKGNMEKSVVREYLYLPEQVQLMLRIAVREMFGFKNEDFIVQQLTKKETQETFLNNPAFNNIKRLRSDGPRMGAVLFTGDIATRLQERTATGGFDVAPVMFQFGYQFEKQYLNEGKFQGLFEFILMVTGLDQSLFIPSLSILHGIRNNKNGWEFAFGPTFKGIAQAEGYYDNGIWRLKTEQTSPNEEIIKRLDSRGNYELRTGFVIACGKTFRSGKMNIPLNAYFVPRKDGMQFGLSFGFNAKNE
jgi:hypothetical protein